MHIRLYGIASALVGGLLVLGTVPAGASATGDSLQNGSGELCLNSTAAGTVSGIYCSGATNTQQWTAPYVSGGVGDADEVFQLQNVLTGQCLTASAGGSVITTSCGASAQDWTDGGSDILINTATGFCLNGANPEAPSSEAVDMTTCGNVDNPPDGQQWSWGGWE